MNRQEFSGNNVQIKYSTFIQQILLHYILDTRAYQREENYVNNINDTQLLARIVDMIIEVENMFGYNNLFILSLYVQLLIIVVHIYSLILNNIDTVEAISHILRS